MSVRRRILLAWILSALAASALAFFRVLTAIAALRAGVIACTILGFVLVLLPPARLRLLEWLERQSEPVDAGPDRTVDDLLSEALTDPDAALRLAQLLERLVASACERAPSPALSEAVHLLAEARTGLERRQTFDRGTLEEILDALEQSWTVS